MIIKSGSQDKKSQVLQNDIDLLNPPAELEKRKHKLKRLVQSPNSFFMDVKCQGCFKSLPSSVTHKLLWYAGTARQFCASLQEERQGSPKDALSGKSEID